MFKAFSDVDQDGTYLLSLDGNLYPVDLTHGYVVAVKPADTDAVPPLDSFVGRWEDTETGVVYWDEVEVIEDLLTAGNVARQRGEIAIWDCFNNCEFRV